MTDHLKKHSEGTHNYCGICNKGLSKAPWCALLQAPLKLPCSEKYSAGTGLVDIQGIKASHSLEFVFGWFLCAFLEKSERSLG